MNSSLTIVTVCLNAEEFISKCLESVKLNISDIDEYIVIDGGSTDCTPQIIKSYSDIIDIYVSEKDDGISAAFNKGINLASSDYILLLNADDFLLPEGLREVKASLVSINNIYCPIHTVMLSGHFYQSMSNAEKLKYSCSVAHPGCIIPRCLYEAIGPYDDSLKVAMDYDFFCRANTSNIKFMNIPQQLVVFRHGGMSANTSFNSLREVYSIRRKYFKVHFPMSELFRLSMSLVSRILVWFGLFRTLDTARKLFLSFRLIIRK
jgi:glycosyltransferase involved in cell wall biosynthesis